MRPQNTIISQHKMTIIRKCVCIFIVKFILQIWIFLCFQSSHFLYPSIFPLSNSNRPKNCIIGFLTASNIFKVSLVISCKIYATLQIFLLPKVQVLPASHFPQYFHCSFDSQQMLVMSHCTLTVHQMFFLILQLLPAIFTFPLRKKLQFITCQKNIQ